MATYTVVLWLGYSDGSVHVDKWDEGRNEGMAKLRVEALRCSPLIVVDKVYESGHKGVKYFFVSARSRREAIRG